MDEDNLISRMDEILPDAVQLVENQTVKEFQQAALETRQSCDEVSKNLLNEYQSAIAACKIECSSAAENCTSCYLSALNDHSLKISGVISKCKNAVSKALQTSMSQALEHVQSQGVAAPTEDQILSNFAGSGGVATKLTPKEGAELIATVSQVKCPDGKDQLNDINGCPFCVVDDPTQSNPNFTQVLWLQSDLTWGPKKDDSLCSLISQAYGITGGSTPGSIGTGGQPSGSPPPTTGGTNSGSSGTPQGGTDPNVCIPPAFQIGTNPDGTPICSTGNRPPFEPPPITGDGNGQTQPGGSGGGTGGTGETPPPVPTQTPPHMENGVCCFPPVPAVKVACISVGRQPPPYWVVIDTTNCVQPECCIYQGDLPPLVVGSQRLVGPFSTYDEATAVCNTSIQICIGNSPPPVVPPPPDTLPPPTTFPPPTPEPTKPPPPTTETGVNIYCKPDYLVSRYKELISTDFSGTPQITPSEVCESLLGVTDKSDPPSIVGLISGFLTGDSSTIFGFAADKAKSAVCNVISGFANLTASVSTTLGCESSSFVINAVENALINIFGGWFGLVPDQLRQRSIYDLNMSCQYLLPNAADANEMYTRGEIDKENWNAIVAANGFCIPWQEKLLSLTYTRPTVGQAIQLLNRGAIEDEEFNKLMTYNKVIGENEVGNFKELAKFVPGPADIVHFMVRDVFDENVVAQLQLDSEFNDKYTGQAKEFAKSQGISDDVMLFNWRSHWQIPSASQLYDSLHRIREDKVLPDGVTTVPAVTLDEVIKTLKINDMSPAWVSRLAYLSFNPFNKRDIRSLFERDELTEDEVVSAFQDLGYPEEKAKTLKDWIVKVTAEKKGILNGIPKVSDILKLYDTDGIDREGAKNLLSRLGINDNQSDSILDVSDQTREAKLRTKNISALRRRFLMGEYDVSTVQSKLNTYGVSADRIDKVISQWKEELSLKYKQPTIAALCKWVTRGYISSSDYLNRIVNLGYTTADASNFVSSCVADFGDKLAKEAKAAAKEKQAALEKQRKEAEKFTKDNAPCKPPPKPVCHTNGQSVSSSSA